MGETTGIWLKKKDVAEAVCGQSFATVKNDVAWVKKSYKNLELW